MAEGLIKPMVQLEDLKLKKIHAHLKEGVENARIHYNPDIDGLLLSYADPDKETVVFYTDVPELALVYTPENLEVVGFWIEGFRSKFMKRHKEIQGLWKINKNDRPDDYGDVIHIYEERKQRLSRTIAEEAGSYFGGPRRELVHA